jgi:hypothetical protein
VEVNSCIPGWNNPASCGATTPWHARNAGHSGRSPGASEDFKSGGFARSIGNGCACLNAEFKFARFKNLFIVRSHNPAGGGFVSRILSKRWLGTEYEETNAN